MKGPLLVVVEGANDLDFLAGLTAQLHRADSDIPSLAAWQAAGRLVMLPAGGGRAAAWPERFAPLGLCEFHLYDREQQPESDLRQQAVDRINGRFGCRAFLTRKRALENYLHPQAIRQAGGPEITFGDHDSVPQLLAERRHEPGPSGPAWSHLPARERKRQMARMKRWLSAVVMQYMTARLLNERDPRGEVRTWLAALTDLVAGQERPAMATSRQL
jgi:hypothetical protein